MSLSKISLTTLIVMLLLSSTVLAEGSKKYTQNLVDASEGDYFSYDADTNGLFNEMTEDPELEDVRNSVDPYVRITYHGESCVNIESDCHRSVFEVRYNFRITWAENSDYTDDTVMKSSITQTIEQGDGEQWTESVLTLDMWMEINGEDYYFEEVETVTTTSIVIGSTPTEISVGDSWTVSTEEESITTTRSRLNSGDWDTETTESSDSITMSYAAESSGNVFVDGTGIDGIKVSAQEAGSTAKDVYYSSEYGIPLKIEIYDEEGALMEIYTLKEYRYENEPSRDNGLELPGFGSVAAASMIGVATLLPRKK